MSPFHLSLLIFGYDVVLPNWDIGLNNIIHFLDLDGNQTISSLRETRIDFHKRLTKFCTQLERNFYIKQDVKTGNTLILKKEEVHVQIGKITFTVNLSSLN